MNATVPLRRNRDFVLLWSGQVVSAIGTRITSIAYPLLVLALTHSPAKAGIVGFLQTLPFLIFHLPAGALVDRWNRKRVMLACDAGRALALGSIAVALAAGRLALPQIAVIAFIEGALYVFFQLAESAALPQVVPRLQLAEAMAQNEARREGADLVGRPLGGVLFGVARVLPFAFDALSYTVSFVTLLFVRPAFQEERAPSPARLRGEIVEGAHWVWRQPFIRTAVLFVAASNFIFSGLQLVLIVRAKDLGASPALIGAMFVFSGGAGIAGSLVAPWAQRRLEPRLVLLGTLWLWAAATSAYAAIPNALALGAVYGLTFLVSPAFNVVLGSYRYALVPDRLLARVQSVNLTVGWGAIPLGPLVAGLLLEAVGARRSLLGFAVAAICVAAAGTVVRTIRRAPRPESLVAVS